MGIYSLEGMKEFYFSTILCWLYGGLLLFKLQEAYCLTILFKKIVLINPYGPLMEPTYLSWSQSGFYQESIRSLPGVHTLYQESIRSPPGVHQEYQDFIRTPDGVQVYSMTCRVDSIWSIGGVHQECLRILQRLFFYRIVRQ